MRFIFRATDRSIVSTKQQKEVPMRFISLTSVFIWLLGIFLWVEPVLAEFSFKGKTVRMISPGSVGGGTDRAGRLVGQFLPKYLPGNPRLVYQSIPGAGGVKGTNYFYQRVKPDGLSLMQSMGAMADPNILRMGNVRFNPLEFPVIGGFNRGGSVFFVRKGLTKRLYDRSAEPVVVAAASGLWSWSSVILWGQEFLGWNARWVLGYPGTTAFIKAIRSGEADMSATGNAYLLDGLKDDKVVDLIAQEGILSGGKYIPRSSYRDVPVFPELLKKGNVSKLAWRAYTSWNGVAGADKWLGLPPGTPKEVVQTYRRAFEKLVKDPEFLKLARKQLSVDIQPLYAKELTKMIRDLVNTPDEAVKYAAKLRVKYGLPGGIK